MFSPAPIALAGAPECQTFVRAGTDTGLARAADTGFPGRAAARARAVEIALAGALESDSEARAVTATADSAFSGTGFPGTGAKTFAVEAADTGLRTARIYLARAVAGEV